MTRLDPAYINSDDPNDLEIGACAWSKTHTVGEVPRGGTILAVNLDDSDDVISVVVLQQHPGWLDTWELVRSDVDMPVTSWYGRNARVAAEIINKWLGSKAGPRDNHVKLMWQRRALLLAEAGASGQWLPGALRRANRHEAAAS